MVTVSARVVKLSSIMFNQPAMRLKRLIAFPSFLILSTLMLGACDTDRKAFARHFDDEQSGINLLETTHNAEVAINRFFKTSSGKKVVVSKFEDLTGARSQNGTSSVVASSGRILTEYILMKANTKKLYSVLDRSELAGLVNERRLAEQVNADNEKREINAAPVALRVQMQGRVAPIIDIKPLKVSDYLIYGAIVGYDRNLVDDGSGAALAGFGVRNRFSRDQINVIIQLVDVNSGEIISTGYASRMIESSSVGVSMFKFLSQDRLIEFEQTQVINDPTTRALFLAIDGALLRMFTDV